MNSEQVEESELVEKVRSWYQDSKAYLSIPYLDTQHFWLVRLIMEMGEVIEHSEDIQFQEKYPEFLNEACRYAKEHFLAEEELMRHFHYPSFVEHKKRHENFVNSLNTLKNRPISKESAVLLHRFLKQWLSTHILKEDRHFASFFARRRVDTRSFFERYAQSGHELSEKEKKFYQEVLGEAHHLVELKPETIERISQTFTSLHLQVGIPIIDIQHLWLIKLIIDLEDSLNARLPHQEKEVLYITIFSELFRYVKEHFRAEELFMESLGYAEFKNHQEKHQLFQKDLEFKYKVFGKNFQERVVVSLLKDLREWLFTHIAMDDRKLYSLVEKNPNEAALVSKKLLQDKRILLLPIQIALYRAILAKQKISNK